MVCAPQRRRTVRDHDDGAPMQFTLEQLHELVLAFRVQHRRGFIEHEYLGARQQRARDRHALPLTTGDPPAVFPDSRVEPVRETVEPASKADTSSTLRRDSSSHRTHAEVVRARSSTARGPATSDGPCTSPATSPRSTGPKFDVSLPATPNARAGREVDLPCRSQPTIRHARPARPRVEAPERMPPEPDSETARPNSSARRRVSADCNRLPVRKDRFEAGRTIARAILHRRIDPYWTPRGEWPAHTVAIPLFDESGRVQSRRVTLPHTLYRAPEHRRSPLPSSGARGTAHGPRRIHRRATSPARLAGPEIET